MKKSIVFVAGIAAIVMAFASCNNGNGKNSGSKPGKPETPETPVDPVTPVEPEDPDGPWTKFLKIDSDPETFSVDDTQSKFQFQLTNFEVAEGDILSFCFIPCESCTGVVTFRDVTNNEKWFYNQTLPAEVNDVLDGSVEDCTITKLDDKWYECKAKATGDIEAIGFTFVLPSVPDGTEVVYLRDFAITSGEETTICKISDFSVAGTESSYTFEKYVVSSGIRAQVVSSIE